MNPQERVQAAIDAAANVAPTQHPGLDALEDYALQRGPQERQELVGLHLTSCRSCSEKAADVLRSERTAPNRPALIRRWASYTAAALAAGLLLWLGGALLREDDGLAHRIPRWEREYQQAHSLAQVPETPVILPRGRLDKGAGASVAFEFLWRGRAEGVYLLLRPISRAADAPGLSENLRLIGEPRYRPPLTLDREDEAVKRLAPNEILLYLDQGFPERPLLRSLRFEKRNAWPTPSSPPVFRAKLELAEGVEGIADPRGWEFEWALVAYGQAGSISSENSHRFFFEGKQDRQRLAHVDPGAELRALLGEQRFAAALELIEAPTVRDPSATRWLEWMLEWQIKADLEGAGSTLQSLKALAR